MTFAVFPSNQTPSTPTTFRVLSDNDTTTNLVGDLYEACGTHLPSWTPSQILAAYTGDAPASQVVQYYRASSIALSLDVYNNSAAVYGAEGTVDSVLPSGIDTTLLDCLNRTIGEEAPLVDSARRQYDANPGIMLMCCCLWWWIYFLLD